MSDRLNRAGLRAFLETLNARLDRPARLYLLGEASLVLAGERPWTQRPVVYTADTEDRPVLAEIVGELAKESGWLWVDESPADVVPLPAGHQERARPADEATGSRLGVCHFDPYSVAIRAIARGDEPDYHVALGLLRLGWITIEELDGMLEDLLPGFSNDTLAQDPAEFRRKLKGLRQMWKAEEGRRGKGTRVWQDTPRKDTLGP